jgi:hypothetical protein
MNFIAKLAERLFGPANSLATCGKDACGAEARTDQGYVSLPGSRQWSPGAPKPVNEENWISCHHCGRKIPGAMDWTIEEGRQKHFGTWTYVCPLCEASHVGTPIWSEDCTAQQTCHECGAELGQSFQCPKCSFPRGWMRVDCPTCKKRHPVFAPHWVARCDLFHLECVHCKSQFVSLCIC